MRTGLAEMTRQTMKEMGCFTRAELVEAVPCRSRKDLERSRSVVVRDFVRSGEIVEVEPGRFKYVGKERRRSFMDIIWHLVRSHRVFTATEIERLSGAERVTVTEYLQCLKALGYLRKLTHYTWQMINDPGPQTPMNTGKCARLRKRRRKGGSD